MRPSTHLVFGAVTATVAASISTIDLPYYAIAATGTLIVVLAIWLTLTIRGVRATTPQR
ncbi:hypothetical protein NOGI109294_04630 [Nocardiopsis gilva]|uniref:hypothetical protein n=1 Tax=Nocardiopsis gilva TaxID=280236 RepID=UPI0003474DF8|nr:hypothetical protein [Nocardiopsis gilva]